MFNQVDFFVIEIYTMFNFLRKGFYFMKPKSIQAKLFYTYSLLITGVISIIVISFYFYISDILQKNASASLLQLSTHINTEFDSELKNMNSSSIKVLYSAPLRELFFSSMFGIDKSSIDDQRHFNNIIYPIIGYDKPFKSINMFRVTGEFASIGDISQFSTISASRFDHVPWVNDTLRLNGKRNISLPHMDDWSGRGDYVISLVRAFAPAWGEEVNSILEVQQDYRKFVNMIENAQYDPDRTSNKEIEVFVLNEQGHSVYPLDTSSAKAQAYWEMVNEHRNRAVGAQVFNSQDSRNIMAFSVSDFSNWTVIVAEPKSELLAPVNTFRNAILLIGIMTVFITLMISYWVSRSLTIPIKKVMKSIRLLSLSSLPPNQESGATSTLNELEHLSLAFNDMRIRLQQSLEELVAARAHELEAHNFALQAQMNPHFLYNTITNISIVAEENGQLAIVEWCNRISQMLRYISSNHAAPVAMFEELEHTVNYLNLMQLRYEDNLQFVIDVPEEFNSIKVPKLMIQPIVENFIKYGIHVEPPWIVSITGTMCADRWELSIRDNGHGFTDEQRIKIMNQFKETNPLVKIPSLRISGMGLLNIYTRLKLLYENRVTLDVENHPDGGALITITVMHKLGREAI